MRTETIIALSANDFSKLDHLEKDIRKTAIDSFIKALKNVEQQIEALTAERDEYKTAYENSVKLALKKSVPFEKMKVFLCKFLDEFEGQFDADGRCSSNEIAVDYITAAKFMKETFGRDDAKRTEHVQNWIDKQ